MGWSDAYRESLRLGIHIGYHKAASSWLQSFLFNNREIGFISPFLREEIGEMIIYPNGLEFSAGLCASVFREKIERAIASNLVPVISYERLSGNPHSGGYDSKEIADRLKQVFPDAKILIIIREQMSMIVSTYKQYIIEGGVCGPARYLKPTVEGRGRLPFFSLNYFQYHRLIRYYIDLFGRNNVLVLPFELFRNNPDYFISKIAAFYSISPCNKQICRFFNVRINPSLSGIAIFAKRFFNFFVADDRLNPAALFPSANAERIITWWLGKIDRHLPEAVKRASTKRLREKLHKHIGVDYFCSSNIETARLTGLELEKYGYSQ